MTYLKDKVLLRLDNQELENALKDSFILDKDFGYLDDYSLVIFDKTNASVFEYIKYLKQHFNILVAMVFESDDIYLIKRAYSYGVDEIILKPVNLELTKLRLLSLVNKAKSQKAKDKKLHDLENTRQKTQTMMHQLTLEIISKHQSDTAKHLANIKDLTYKLLMAIKEDHQNISDEWIETVCIGACFHDIGKMAISDEIINANRVLSSKEKESLKMHTIIGEKMFQNLLGSFDKTKVLEWMSICRWHHERIDGSGYPDGLSGDLIPLSAQIVGLVDCFEALVAKRSYKKALSGEKALEMIRNGACGAFNPKLVKYLEKIQNNFSLKA